MGFRQIHLDFHTSEHIPGIGSDFDPDDFASTLAEAAVDSVTCFARGHHGFIYYPSQLNPERIHPHLVTPDLLPQQIEACHKRGIRVPIYITVQWDLFSAQQHPEWLCLQADKTPTGSRGVFGAGFYEFLDVFHPGYREFLAEHTKEVLQMLDVDGIFFDICSPQPSCAPHWIRAMDDAGLDPEDGEQRSEFAKKVMNEWMLEMSEMIRSIDPDCTIFYNSGHVGPRHRPSTDAFTHYELESLPSGGWGYLHFPLAVRYARNLGKACLGMTGKFHTSWGDFHSYKNAAALEYECFTMISQGAACSVGDQLHPTGVIDGPTYDLIGEVYRSVREKQPWCENAEPICDIAVITPEAFLAAAGSTFAQAGGQPSSAMGLTRMFEELRLQFEVLDAEADLTPFKLVVLPDRIPIDDALRAKLEAFMGRGGTLLASYASGLEPGGERFALDTLGVQWLGEAEYSPDFVLPANGIGAALPEAPHVMYSRGMKVAATTGQTLCDVHRPYFERTWRHFCSHRHTPSAGETAYPGVVAGQRSVYFAHPVFDEYFQTAPKWIKQLVADAIDRLLPQRSLQVEGPSTLHATLMHQPEHHRRVVHLLHYLPEKRAANFEVIEEAIPLYHLPVTVQSETPITSATLVPQGDTLDISETQAGGYRVIVPELHGHQMIELR